MGVGCLFSMRSTESSCAIRIAMAEACETVADYLDISVEVTLDFGLTEIVAELDHAGAPEDLAQPDIAGRLLKRVLEY